MANRAPSSATHSQPTATADMIVRVPAAFREDFKRWARDERGSNATYEALAAMRVWRALQQHLPELRAGTMTIDQLIGVALTSDT